MGNCAPEICRTAEATTPVPNASPQNSGEREDDEVTELRPESESVVKMKSSAKRQRRRLSVTPAQVGDINKFKNSNSNTNTNPNPNTNTHSRRFSVLGNNHIPQKQEPKRFVAISKKGFIPYNTNKVNQDSYFCEYTFGEDNCRLFGVCDGHGEFGHNVSNFVARKLPKYIAKYDYKADPRSALRKACAEVADGLKKGNINTTFSGTTLVFSLFIGNEVYTANLGDSRGVIAEIKSADKENVGDGNSPKPAASSSTLISIPLSIDHKPELPVEKSRILRSGGRVEPLPGPPGEDSGPHRVWLADVDVPGLAMSRSLGDDVAHSVGVSNDPEILQHTISENSQFIIYGSDGIWEFIANEEACHIVHECLPDLREAALRLVKTAISRWRAEEEVIDDITAIIYNLKDNSEIDSKHTSIVTGGPSSEDQ